MAKTATKKSATRVKRSAAAPIEDKLRAGANRLTEQTDVSDNRFRKRYRTLSAAELALNDAIKDHAAKLEFLFQQLPPDTEYSNSALHYLEIAVMFGIKELTGSPLNLSEADAGKIMRKVRSIKAD